MKKTLLLVLLAALCAVMLAGCGKKADSPEPTSLSFSESAGIETLESLDGKKVTITGYMATLSPLDGSYIYLMNMPYQSCPFCVPNTTQLANTMAVYAREGSEFEFTDRPVKITGTLKVADMVDDYGYTYNYYIADAGYEIVDLSNVSAEYALYQSLSADGTIADVNAMFDYLMFLCQWTEYQGYETDEAGNQTPFYMYPADVEYFLSSEATYGYSQQASDSYFPDLIARVEAVSATELSDLVAIIEDSAAVAEYALNELRSGSYTYSEEADKYTLNNDALLYEKFYEVYAAFSEWLAKYEL